MDIISTSWQDALGMLPECKIIGKPKKTLPAHLELTCKDPSGQLFMLVIEGRAQIGLDGDLVTVNPFMTTFARKLSPDELQAVQGD